MKNKTAGLSYPLNAMRELQELDAIPKRNDPEEAEPSFTSEHVTSSQVASTTSSEAAHATSSVGSSDAKKRQTRKEHSRSSDAQDDSVNPLNNALLELLGKPYSTDETKGPYTISTVKIPTEISERLGYAATLTKQTKQEIISSALKDYFKRVLREQ